MATAAESIETSSPAPSAAPASDGPPASATGVVVRSEPSGASVEASITVALGDEQAAVVGFVVAALQAASQIQDPTLSHLPRLLAVTVALAILGPWMGHEVAAFAAEMFAQTAAQGSR